MWLVTDDQGAEVLPWLPQRIFCIGRNYAEHAREMGHDPNLEPPFFFCKPLTALCAAQGNWQLPDFSEQVEHELELVLGLSVPPDSGRNVSSEQAQSWISSAALGLDMTCRDLQREAKKAGRPWDLAKGFDNSAVLTPFVQLGPNRLQNFGDMQLAVNGSLRQQGNWRQMLWSPGDLIAQIARYFTLRSGDIIFTGTPAGVAPLQPGDRLTASMAGLPHRIELNIQAP